MSFTSSFKREIKSLTRKKIGIVLTFKLVDLKKEKKIYFIFLGLGNITLLRSYAGIGIGIWEWDFKKILISIPILNLGASEASGLG